MTSFEITPSDLATYLESQGIGTRVRVTDFDPCEGGGARVTIPFEVTYRTHGGTKTRRLVARARDPGANATPVDVETEFRLLEELRSSRVPAPVPRWLELDESVLGSEFFITSYEHGRTPDVFRKRDRRTLYAAWEEPGKPLPTAFVDVLAGIHSHDATTITSLDSHGRHHLIDQQLEYWRRRLRDGDEPPDPVLVESARWLADNRPTIPETTLVHGDYRVGNLLIEGAEIGAVIDWELARIADPMYDLGFTSLKYFAGKTLAPIERPELASALVDREWLYREYEKRSGRTVDRNRVQYWRVFVLFLIACRRSLRRTTGRQPGPTQIRERYYLPAHLLDLLELITSARTETG